MKNLNNITVIIVTFKTPKEIILNCLRSIDKNVKKIIIENSETFLHEKIIISEFHNIKIICTGENLGYGKGNNFGLKQVQTDYALILNPDVVCAKDLFKKIPLEINKIKNFAIIGFQYSYDKIFMPAGFFDEEKNSQFKENFQNNNVESLSKVEWVTGCSMLINLSEFEGREIFDKNFFLYFEEFDLCKSIINNGGNVFTSKNLKIDHLGFQSSLGENSENKHRANRMREWHWMWSSFYFYKKNYNYFTAFFKMFGKLFKSFIKFNYYSLTFQKKQKEKYLYRFLGIFNSMMGRQSFFRDDN